VEEIRKHADANGNQHQTKEGQTILNDESAALNSLGGGKVEFTLCGSNCCHKIRTWTYVLSLNFGGNRPGYCVISKLAHNLFVSGSSEQKLFRFRCSVSLDAANVPRRHPSCNFPEAMRQRMMALAHGIRTYESLSSLRMDLRGSRSNKA
jgi:hypothetical protein